MKIALIADVHGNLPALEAVLAHARTRGVEAIWNAGDFIGYGAFPDEVVDRLRVEQAVSVVGNYDLKALELGSDKTARKPKRAEKNLAFQWAYTRLSKANRAYLAALPSEVRLEVEGRRVLLVHGSPVSIREPLSEETPEERLRELAQAAGADLILCGHSHRLFRRKVAGVWFVNPGSVGRPDDGDPRAAYALLQFKLRFFQVRHYRVPYDVEREVAALRAQGLPESFAQMTLQGRSLDGVLAAVGAPIATGPGAGGEDFERGRLEAVATFSSRCECDVEHVHQVTHLALRLFDELKPLHGLGRQERIWLHYAALLHDVGWIDGGAGHHKASLRIIQETPLLPFDERERLIIGSIARYHRGALPHERHGHWAALKAPERRIVGILAALLRVADALDCTHQGVVEDLSCKFSLHKITVRCRMRQKGREEFEDAQERGRLLEQVFDRKLILE